MPRPVGLRGEGRESGGRVIPAERTLMRLVTRQISEHSTGDWYDSAGRWYPSLEECLDGMGLAEEATAVRALCTQAGIDGGPR